MWFLFHGMTAVMIQNKVFFRLLVSKSVTNKNNSKKIKNKITEKRTSKIF